MQWEIEAGISIETCRRPLVTALAMALDLGLASGAAEATERTKVQRAGLAPKDKKEFEECAAKLGLSCRAQLFRYHFFAVIGALC